MAGRGFECIDDHRRSMFVTAVGHPYNVIPLAGLSVVFLITGLFVGMWLIIGLDVLGAVAAMRSRRMRDQLSRRADRIARGRAAEHLGTFERGEWLGLEKLAAETTSFNGRSREVEGMLDSFVDTGLTLGYVKKCAESSSVERGEANDRVMDAIVDQRRRAGQRAERAVASLQRQMETTAQLVRLACELAIAERCQAGAELRAAEMEEMDDAQVALTPAADELPCPGGVAP
jgi:hypothetical protein